MNFKQFAEKANAKGLTVVAKPNDHWQIRGGKLLVNYYPNAKKGSTVYVAGTNQGFRATDEEAIETALGNFKQGKQIPKASRKKGGYTKYKMRLLASSPFCQWCLCKLSKKTATIDHKVPLHLGGLNNPNNYVLSCEPCNRRKGHQIW
jgi:hypothetical protein